MEKSSENIPQNNTVPSEENSLIEKCAVNSLALLAAYNSSSDSENDSESTTSSSSSSTSSSSSSSSEEDELTPEVVITNATTYRDALPHMDDESNDSAEEQEEEEGISDEEGKSRAQRPVSRQRGAGIKAKGELDLSDLPPIEDLQISVREEECLYLGKILSIVEQMVLVEAKRGGAVLDLDTVLFVDRGHKVLGKIFDVLGQINQPIYCVRFNSSQQIQEKAFKVGMEVFWVAKPEHSSIVVVSNLMQQKGSDASWEHDIEPPDGCLDYSDDEQERASRQSRRRPQRQSEESPRQQQRPVLRGQRRRPNNPTQRGSHQVTNNLHWYQQQYPPAPPMMPTWGPVYVNPFAYPMMGNNMPLMQQPPPPPPPPPQPQEVIRQHEEPPPPGCN